MSAAPAPPVSARSLTAVPFGLLQPWIENVPQEQRRLGLFVAAALAVHVAAFFFIRIDAARSELQHATRTHVTIEDRQSVGAAAAETYEFMDQLADPRLFLFPAQPLSHLDAPTVANGNPTLGLNFTPPEMPAPAALADAPLSATTTPDLQQQAALDLHPARQEFTYTEPPLQTATKTTWQWDASLGSRLPTAGPELPSPVSDTELNPTELRIAIGPDGAVNHVLLENTCQKPELDQQAVLAARKLRFPPSENPVETWTRVTIFWHVTAPPQEVIVPTPPST